MSSKLLAFVQGMNRPLERFIVKQGWNLRLGRKKLQGVHFRPLTPSEKKQVQSYWRQYKRRVSPAWAAYYGSSRDVFDPRFIPESLYYSEIVPKLGDLNMRGLGQKNVQEQVFSSKQARTLVRKEGQILTGPHYRPLTGAEAVDLCRQEGRVIIKPARGSYGGRGIQFWSQEEGEEKLRAYLEAWPSLTVQEVIRQHSFFANIHPQSLNTLRLVSLIVDNRPVLLSAIMRMGQGGSRLDNSSAGGLIAALDQEGRLKDRAVQSDQSVLTGHPGGFVFKGARVPSFDRVREDMYAQCMRVSCFRMVFWDYAIDEAGDPVLIEANIPAGQIASHQFNNGPLFGDYTDRVLAFVYKGGKL